MVRFRSIALLLACAVPVLACVVPAAPASAQAVVNPNQVVGQATFTNVNPVIRAVLADTRGIPWPFAWSVSATTVDAPVTLSAATSVSTAHREGVAYELTVESSQAGYRYSTSLTVQTPAGSDGYEFARQESAPVRLEPEPDIRLDFTECAALLRFTFVGSGGAACPIASGSAVASKVPGGKQAWALFPAGSTHGELLVRGDGVPTEVIVVFTLGSDPFSDEITYIKQYTVAPGCDEIVDLECRGDDQEADCPRGRIVGRFDVVGEDEIPRGLGSAWPHTWVKALNGPHGNRRYDGLWSDPASGPFELENLVSSECVDPARSYLVEVSYEFGRGTRYHSARSPREVVPVGCGETVDLGDTFVMTPSRVEGPLQLAGPPATTPLGSPFDHLSRITDPVHDANGDGIPDDPNRISHESAVVGSWSGGPNVGLTIPTYVRATFPGAVESGSSFVGTHELVFAAPGPDAKRFDASELDLVFHALTGGPDAYLSARVVIEEIPLRATWLAPGDRLFHERSTCFGLVRLGYVATSGQFFAPYASVKSYVAPRRDYRGRTPAHDVDGFAGGTPTTQAEASDRGLVLLPLPEGRYVLEPRVWAINPGGGTSRVQVLDVGVKAGCRQVLDVLPELVVELDDLAPCAQDGLVRISGRVHSTEVVARAWASVVGVGETTLCEPCGVSPEVGATIVLGATDHAVTIHAVDVSGRVAGATAHALLAREPSALDVRPQSAPLRVARAGLSELALSWEATGEPANVYRGTLRSLAVDRAYDHAGMGACDVVGGGVTTALPAQDSYYLVTGTCAWGDTPPGRDSMGRARPGAIDRCP